MTPEETAREIADKIVDELGSFVFDNAAVVGGWENARKQIADRLLSFARESVAREREALDRIGDIAEATLVRQDYQYGLGQVASVVDEIRRANAAEPPRFCRRAGLKSSAT